MSDFVVTVDVVVDRTQLDAAIERLGHLPLAGLAKLVKFNQIDAKELISISPAPVRGSRNVVIVRLLPSYLFNRLLAAAEAGNFDAVIDRGVMGCRFNAGSSEGVATTDDIRVGGSGLQPAASGSEGGAA